MPLAIAQQQPSSKAELRCCEQMFSWYCCRHAWLSHESAFQQDGQPECIFLCCLAAGDLSVGDPGFSAGAAGAGGAATGGEWWSPEGELLSAPKRMAGRGVSYQRTAKQVGVPGRGTGGVCALRWGGSPARRRVDVVSGGLRGLHPLACDPCFIHPAALSPPPLPFACARTPCTPDALCPMPFVCLYLCPG